MPVEPLNLLAIDQFLDDVGSAARELVTLFINETHSRLERMEQQTNAADWKALGDEAHALKSSSGTYGISALSSIAADLESACHEERATDAIRHMGLLKENAESTLNDYLALIDDKLGG